MASPKNISNTTLYEQNERNSKKSTEEHNTAQAKNEANFGDLTARIAEGRAADEKEHGAILNAISESAEIQEEAGAQREARLSKTVKDSAKALGKKIDDQNLEPNRIIGAIVGITLLIVLILTIYSAIEYDFAPLVKTFNDGTPPKVVTRMVFSYIVVSALISYLVGIAMSIVFGTQRKDSPQKEGD